MARSIHLSGCADSVGARTFILQPLFARFDNKDTICSARTVINYCSNSSQAVSLSSNSRWHRNLAGSSRNVTNGHHFEDTTSTSSVERQHRKFGSRSEIYVRCQSPKEAPTSESTQTLVTPATLWEELKSTVSYLSSSHLSKVKDALQLAFEAHDGQKRRSGEPFIIHPVAVAGILGELEMDWETVVAGLLHDTVEDTEHVTFERIEEQFGTVVRRIVEGETKVSKLGKMQCQNSPASSRDVKADDLRQMFLAMTEEVRVIIVKLADRLHNMRTLAHMPPHKQKYIADETLQVFAPLAKLLGMYRIKSELEDLSFMYSNGEEYERLKNRVLILRKEQEEVLLEAKNVVLDTILKDQFLSYMTVEVKVLTRYKELYSIHKKIAETKCSVDEIRDIAQLRVILKMKPGASLGQLCTAQQVCYHVLGLVHAMWPPVPQTVKDYIATPKPNGYQSLHTTVIPFGSKTYFPLEIQIRTEEMDKLAEWGIAAHHSGKGNNDNDAKSNGAYSGNGVLVTNGSTRHGWNQNLNDAEIARRVSWLNSIREWQEEFVGNMTSREFVDTITGDLLGSRVFVFTPKGEVKNLPKGATVVDYAYQIHTDVGNNMVAAKVNGNIVSPTHTLANAEVVEIVTYEGVSQKKLFELHRQWLQFARTRSARHKLTKFLKEQAALSAVEITAESVNDFLSEFDEGDLDVIDDDEAEGRLDSGSFASSSSRGRCSPLRTDSPNGRNVVAYWSKGSGAGNREPGEAFSESKTTVNGKHSKLVEEMFGKMGRGSSNGAALASSSGGKITLAVIEDESRYIFEAWQAGRVAMWHGSGGRSLQWISICCMDRRSMLGEVTSLLGASGIHICACAAETDQTRGLGIMIFHVESNFESLVELGTNLENVEGIINWAMGCSWHPPQNSRPYLNKPRPNRSTGKKLLP
ncbi:GTP pyrophosphokinase [Marchantia polymorpha subsp. ruderalis]|uniref:Putative GTP diphosphokinase RSH1, chloroplastic n=2 Tax=Marchantia polymorpha TaxID=3197 RepID=A0AAF6BPE1_MARPO|nr:hypothetical protein MARPO_0053s0023 [Marchantia polymorpha]BBN13875.1 hypothetical protein Mp_6g07090 [Marchantia polymorpha subsp. ruderalis]|eukprot:PTQ38076.1 hypothetical protein MARPO_0053s0023 [Marchantia polymorpha]